jgi:predicted esterase
MVRQFESGGRATGSTWLSVLAAGTLAAVPPPVTAQTTGGQLEELVTSASDTSQKYALYLPPGYAPDREWPILFVLDPRARAVFALKLFEGAARKHGWVVMSSHNSRSDTFPAVTENAMEAMLKSAQERLSIDRSRLYLAGFSGTARAALRFAVTLRGHVAGVVAVGGALGFEFGGPETVFARDSTFAYFGAAGTRDFNHDEVVAMADRFGTMHVPFRVAVFEGSHSWPPVDVCSQALEWLELRAMRSGRRATDSAWVRVRLLDDVAQAAELERRGQSYQALRLYEAITRDYPPWPEARAAAERAGALSNTAAVKRYQAQARSLADKSRQQDEELQEVLQWARSSPNPPTAETLVRKLKLAELKKTAERGDSLRAASAERLLARMFAWLAYYEPGAYLANRSPDRALTMLAAATKIGPLQGESCAMLHAALGSAPAKQQTALKGQCPRGSSR